MRKSIVAATMLSTIVLLGSNTTAMAHGELVGTSPSAGEVITTPVDICVEYSEEILLAGSAVVLSDSTGAPIVTGEAKLVENSLCVGWPVAVVPGEITVSYRIVGADGHNVSDEYTFEYAQVAIASSEPTLIAPAPSVTATAEPTNSTNNMLWTGLGFLAIAVIILALWLNRKD